MYYSIFIYIIYVKNIISKFLLLFFKYFYDFVYQYNNLYCDMYLPNFYDENTIG